MRWHAPLGIGLWALWVAACQPPEEEDGDGSSGDSGGTAMLPGEDSTTGESVDSTGQPPGEGTDTGNTTGSTTDDPGDDSTGSTSEGDTTGEPADVFDIAFDYRFDRQMAIDLEIQAVFEFSAQQWEDHILSEFDDIPAGTALRIRHPEMPGQPGMVFEVEYDIDDLVIFPGFAPLDGQGGSLAITSHSFTYQVKDAALLAALEERFEGPVFQPWVANTTFDPAEAWFVDPTPQTTDDIPMNLSDMRTTATHELGHALGIGSSAAFEALVDAASETFVGPRAMEIHGGPVPLSSDLLHIRGDVLSDGVEPVMAYGTANGQYKYPTSLDLAILEDIGYLTDL